MKRKCVVLVDYASSDDEDGNSELPAELSRQGSTSVKKRKLPPVSSSLVLPGPVDDPTLHQGRIRTTPHIEGQFAAHVYVSVALNRRDPLYKTVQDILSDAKREVPALHEIAIVPKGLQRAELHISLSRPIFLRAHQREDLKRVVQNLANTHKSFTLSFAELSELINDEKTRTFLTMEVGAGHHELHTLTKAIGPLLQSIRQLEYYPNPKFHASIAWALLYSPAAFLDSTRMCGAFADDPSVSAPDPGPHDAPTKDTFPTILQFPPEMIVALNRKYGRTLSSPKVGSFDVEAVSVKIGKEVSSWKLAGL